jgi:PfaD family protein
MLLATLPATYPEWLGDRGFCDAHGVRFPYIAGAMANGIGSTELVAAMARGGFLAFFGAAGLSPQRVEAAIERLESELGRADEGGLPWGSNLIHSPNEPSIEAAVADLYIRRGVRRVSASAYLALTPAIVRYACTGLTQDEHGRVHRLNHVFAKISRPETARPFMEPAPRAILDELVVSGQLTRAEADLAGRVPLAEDITCESDSGGHTDNRPLATLLPTIARLRDQVQAGQGYDRPIRVGAAGGLGTPAALASAFALGAAYVLTGSVNQATVESGLHAEGKAMLAGAGLADVTMAPAADMFEMGVEVQVLKRGTMFAVRARKLWELYRAHQSWDEVAAPEQRKVEADILRSTFDEAWASTREYWSQRDPAEIDQAEADPHHKMALVFRGYLGLSSHWSINGDLERRTDFQIWCGPAMGAFNAWTAGTFLAEPANRHVVLVANNLLEGAAVVTRAQQLRSFGVPLPAAAFDFRPRPIA